MFDIWACAHENANKNVAAKKHRLIVTRLLFKVFFNLVSNDDFDTSA